MVFNPVYTYLLTRSANKTRAWGCCLPSGFVYRTSCTDHKRSIFFRKSTCLSINRFLRYVAITNSIWHNLTFDFVEGCGQPRVVLNNANVTVKGFLPLLEYAYTSVLNVPQSDVNDVFLASVHLHIQPVSDFLRYQSYSCSIH